jgi:hypothetical protein
MGLNDVKYKHSIALALAAFVGVGLLSLALYAVLAGRANAQQAPISGNVYQNQAGAIQGGAQENIMILLDSSFSMSERLGRGREDKMTAAKRTVLEVLRNVPPNTRVGLRTYGDSANSFTACRATTLHAAPGLNNRNLIASKMIGVKPTGATPSSGRGFPQRDRQQKHYSDFRRDRNLRGRSLQHCRAHAAARHQR